MQQTKKDFIKKVNGAKNILADIEIKFQLYDCIFNKLSKANSSDILMKYEGYFQHICASLIYTVYLRLYAFLDDDTNSINLNKIIRCFETNKNVYLAQKDQITFDRYIKEIKSRIMASNTTINKIKKYRDKFLAHLDKGYFLKHDDFFSQNSISKKEFSDLISLLVDTVNIFLVLLDEGHYTVNDVSQGFNQFFDEIEQNKN